MVDIRCRLSPGGRVASVLRSLPFVPSHSQRPLWTSALQSPAVQASVSWRGGGLDDRLPNISAPVYAAEDEWIDYASVDYE